MGGKEETVRRISERGTQAKKRKGRKMLHKELGILVRVLLKQKNYKKFLTKIITALRDHCD